VGLAFVAALGLCLFVMSAFNQLTGKSLALDFSNGRQVVGLAAAILLTGLVRRKLPVRRPLRTEAGLGLARRGDTASGRAGRRSGGSAFRRVLVVFQFTLSIILLVGTLTVHKQLRFIRQADLDSTKKHHPDSAQRTFAKQYAVFKTELLGLPPSLR